MKKNNFVIKLILVLFVFLCLSRIVYLGIIRKDYYLEKYDQMKNNFVIGPSAPRGRILDVNGKVLVDNIGVNSVIYNSTLNKIGLSEVEIAKSLGTVLKFDESAITDFKVKTYYIKTHGDGKDLITDEEWKLYKERKLSKTDLEALKYERVTDEILSSLNYEFKNESYIYHILKTGYYFEDKVLKKNLSDEEVVMINDLNLAGIRTELTWERTYPYGSTLRTILGNISKSVPVELKDYYEEKGVSTNSTVGVSFLEREYDSYLRGEDAIYRIENGNLVIEKEEKMGSDVYLSIDIDTTLEVERILKEEMLAAKKTTTAEYFNHAYALVGNPKDGSLLAVVGLMIKDGEFTDISANIIHSSYTVGSIVKGATISVGYSNDLIKMGAYVYDSCIKVYNVPKKCSIVPLGYVDDIRALAQSSNYYQFLIATKLANPFYTWNSKLNARDEHFKIYRDMLSSYGLGAKTGIDLPDERLGIIGKRVSDDLLLNLTIGQYDTYTPIEIYQYISTIANDGTRLAPSLMKKIVKDGEVIVENTPTELNKVPLEDIYIKRIQTGFKSVMTSGTGRGYNSTSVAAAGKTGTSETFVDSDGDGKIDKETVSKAFVMYAPYDDPKYAIVLMSPNISLNGTGYSYKYPLNLRVNRKIVKYLFEKS